MGYAVLQIATQVIWSYMRLQKATHGYIGGCIELRTVTLGYTGLHQTTNGYARLQRSTCRYMRLHRTTKATLGYTGLHTRLHRVTH